MFLSPLLFLKSKPTTITMKNIINLKPNLLHSLCLAGTMFLAASCSENKTTDSKEIAERENVNKLAEDDDTAVVIDNDHATIFLVEAAEMELEEINLGKLAQQKGTSSHVKELGKMMEEEHTKSFNEIKAMAQAKSVSIPETLTDDSKDNLENLQEKTGTDFDKAYSDMMVDHHEDAIDRFERASTESEDPEIRSLASSKLPSLKTHLKHAEECKEKCDNMNS